MTEKFWLVWSPQGRTPPAAKHPTIVTANNEADRLARLNPGQQFFVLTAESLHVKRDVDVIQLQSPANVGVVTGCGGGGGGLRQPFDRLGGNGTYGSIPF